MTRLAKVHENDFMEQVVPNTVGGVEQRQVGRGVRGIEVGRDRFEPLAEWRRAPGLARGPGISLREQSAREDLERRPGAHEAYQGVVPVVGGMAQELSACWPSCRTRRRRRPTARWRGSSGPGCT
jgi:hypothetical protein